MRFAVLTTTLCALLFLPFADGRADEAKDQIKAFEERMKNADPTTQISLIEELKGSGNPGASKAIAKYMSNRDTGVKVAAIKAIGELKDKKYLGKLMGMVKQYDDKDTAKILATVVEAIGNYGDKKSMKTLIDIAKKWLRINSEVASAAARALGKVPHKSAVDELINLLRQTNPSGSGQGGGGGGGGRGGVSAETRELLNKSKPHIIAALQELTGWDFEDPEAWENFWEQEQRSWKPGKLDIDLATVKTWNDPGYCFKIDRPNEKWSIDRTDKYKDYRIYMARVVENATQATVSVWASKNTSGVSPENQAEKYLASYSKRWKDIKQESIVGETVKVGKVKGYLQAFTGRDTHGSAAKVREMFFVHNGMLFIVGSWRRSGLEQDVTDDVMKALESFAFTK